MKKFKLLVFILPMMVLWNSCSEDTIEEGFAQIDSGISLLDMYGFYKTDWDGYVSITSNGVGMSDVSKSQLKAEIFDREERRLDKGEIIINDFTISSDANNAQMYTTLINGTPESLFGKKVSISNGSNISRTTSDYYCPAQIEVNANIVTKSGTYRKFIP